MKTIRKTKIIATLGPSSDSVSVMEEMLYAGMNVARFNFSHGSHEEHRAKLENLRQASANTGIPVATLLDTSGPQIRTGTIKDDAITLQENDKVIVTTDDIEGTNKRISINYKNLPTEIAKGNRILVADGLVELEVENVSGNDIYCVVRNGGSFRAHKNVSIPGISLSIPIITKKDLADIQFAIDEEMDFLALSFVQSAQDIEQAQNILDHSNAKIKVIAKIETQEALNNIASICQTAYGVMVARGDLGVQIRPEEVPIAQKRIIRTSNTLGKVVITATQMLETMVHNIRPTRAEASDVANAILDGTDAVMLSGETAMGKHPVTAVKMMHSIALDIENSLEFRDAPKYTFTRAHSIGSAVSKAAYQLAKETAASVIVTPSLRGNTPLIISKFRPRTPIVAISPSDIVSRQLLMCWGVTPILSEYIVEYEKLIRTSIQLVKEQEFADVGDKIVSIAGLPLDSPAVLNSIRIHFMGRILYRAAGGMGQTVYGPVRKVTTIKHAYETIKKDPLSILLVEKITNAWNDILEQIPGIICRQHVRNIPELHKQFKHLVMICGIHSKLTMLNDGQMVYISGNDNIVYEKE